MKYYLSSSDHVTGPYEKEELVDSFKYGMVSPDSTVCREGTDDWLPISVLTEKKQKTEMAVGPQTPFTKLQQEVTTPVTMQQEHYRIKSVRTAVLLEVLPGLCLFTFGIGNIYAGNIAVGIILMISYWALAIVNFLLLFVVIGFLTWPLTFVTFLVISIISAQRAVDRRAWQTIMTGQRKAF